MRPLRTVAVAALTLATFAACAAGDAEDADSSEDAVTRRPELAQMNDVSILLPLAKTQAEIDTGYLKASSAGARGALLPDTLYTTATGERRTDPSGPLPPGADAGLSWDRLRVVAMRIDPCFANIGPITNPASCKNQLRLVFQSLRFGNGQTSAIDGGVHAFYSLTREELTALVKGVIALRRAQNGDGQLGAIAVHPVVAKQGLLGAEAKGLGALVLQYAGKQNLTRFTVLKPGNLATRWDFSGFDVRGNGTERMVIPTLPDHGTSDSFFAGFAQDLAGGFNPETTSRTDDMQLLGNLEKARAASHDKQQAAFDAALRILNPNKHSPDTIDCASCHIAGPAIVLTGGKLGLSASGNANAFTRDTRWVGASDMKQTTPVNADTNRNFHAFSYRDEHPMIAVRVINETASIVAYLNANVLSRQ